MKSGICSIVLGMLVASGSALASSTVAWVHGGNGFAACAEVTPTGVPYQYVNVAACRKVEAPRLSYIESKNDYAVCATVVTQKNLIVNYVNITYCTSRLGSKVGWFNVNGFAYCAKMTPSGSVIRFVNKTACLNSEEVVEE